MKKSAIIPLGIPILFVASLTWAAWPDDPLINVPVSTVPGEKYDVFLVDDAHDGALIAWEDDRSGQTDIYLQRLDAGGDPVWTPGGIAVCAAAGDQGLMFGFACAEFQSRHALRPMVPEIGRRAIETDRISESSGTATTQR